MVGKFAIQEEVSSLVELEQGRPHLNVFAEVGKSGGEKRGTKREREKNEREELTAIVSRILCHTSCAIQAALLRFRFLKPEFSLLRLGIAVSGLGGAK